MNDDSPWFRSDAAIKLQCTTNGLAVREVSQAIRCLAIAQLDMLKGDRDAAHRTLEQIAGHLSNAAAFLDEAANVALEAERTDALHLDEETASSIGSGLGRLAVDLSIAAGDRAASLTADVRAMQARQDEANRRLDALGLALAEMAAERSVKG